MSLARDLMFAAMYIHSADLKCRAILRYFKDGAVRVPNIAETEAVVLVNDSEVNDECNNVLGAFYVKILNGDEVIAVYRENENADLDKVDIFDWKMKIKSGNMMNIAEFSDLASDTDLRDGDLPGGSQVALERIHALHDGDLS